MPTRLNVALANLVVLEANSVVQLAHHAATTLAVTTILKLVAQIPRTGVFAARVKQLSAVRQTRVEIYLPAAAQDGSFAASAANTAAAIPVQAVLWMKTSPMPYLLNQIQAETLQ